MTSSGISLMQTVPKLLPAQRKIVPVNHLGPTFYAQQKQNITGRPALDLVGIRGVVGDETAADLGAVWIAHDDGVAPGELSLDPNNADRQQAIAAPQRGHRAGVDRERALRLQRAGDPFLA